MKPKEFDSLRFRNRLFVQGQPGINMSASIIGFVVAALLLIAISSGCKSLADKTAKTESSSTATTSSGKPDDQGIIHSGTGEQREPPAAGKANVQGKVLYNGKPAANIEVKLCEKFNQYFGGQIFNTKTDAAANI